MDILATQVGQDTQVTVHFLEFLDIQDILVLVFPAIQVTAVGLVFPAIQVTAVGLVFRDTQGILEGVDIQDIVDFQAGLE